MAADVRTNRLILFATSIGAVLSPLIGSMIVLAMLEIGVAFGVVARDLGWLSTIFILANAIFLISAAQLSYLQGAVVVAVSCALSVVAPTYDVLLGLRVVAACGTSFLMVTGLAILSQVYPPRGRGTAFGVHAAMVYVGGVCGTSSGRGADGCVRVAVGVCDDGAACGCCGGFSVMRSGAGLRGGLRCGLDGFVCGGDVLYDVWFVYAAGSGVGRADGCRFGGDGGVCVV